MSTETAPATGLAAGHTVVLKPAEVTQLTAVRLGELGPEARVPQGALSRVDLAWLVVPRVEFINADERQDNPLRQAETATQSGLLLV